MKTISLMIALVVVSVAQAQKQNAIHKVTAGAVVGVVSSTAFSGSEKPFVIGYNLSPNVTIVTSKTFHNVLYGTGSNSLASLNGYFLNDNWDMYVVYAKTLHTGSNYLGCGIEKMLTAGNLNTFLFTEFGTGFQHKYVFSFGFLISAQHQIWKRK